MTNSTSYPSPAGKDITPLSDILEKEKETSELKSAKDSLANMKPCGRPHEIH
jgi:hypothetical protein